MNAVNTPEEMLAFLATLQASDEPETPAAVEPEPEPAPADVDETVAAIIASMAQEAPSPTLKPEPSEEEIVESVVEHLAAIQEESVLDALKEINTDALKRSIYEAQGVVEETPELSPSEDTPEPSQVAVDVPTQSKQPRKRAPRAPSQTQPKKTGLALDDVSLVALHTIAGGNPEKLLLLEGQSLDSDGGLPAAVRNILDPLPTLAKKQREAVHNIFEWLAGINDLRSYTQVAIDTLIPKPSLTRADLMAAYQARGLMSGTAQAQVSKYFPLMVRLNMAIENLDGSLTPRPSSLIIKKRQAEM